jgi:hypothetical protein
VIASATWSQRKPTWAALLLPVAIAALIASRTVEPDACSVVGTAWVVPLRSADQLASAPVSVWVGSGPRPNEHYYHQILSAWAIPNDQSGPFRIVKHSRSVAWVVPLLLRSSTYQVLVVPGVLQALGRWRTLANRTPVTVAPAGTSSCSQVRCSAQTLVAHLFLPAIFASSEPPLGEPSPAIQGKVELVPAVLVQFSALAG